MILTAHKTLISDVGNHTLAAGEFAFPLLDKDGKLPRVEYIGGRCDGPRCAWWDADKGRCAVLSLARNK